MNEDVRFTWLIGDIHGMYDPLQALITYLDNERLDKFVFLGDYIDYGPSTKAVIDLIMGLGDKAITLMGNHEHLLLQTLYDEWHRERFGTVVWENNGAESTIRSCGYKDIEDSFIWIREDFFKGNLAHWQDYVVIHGHTPTHLLSYYVPDFVQDDKRQVPYIRRHPENERVVSVNIDTGAAFGNCLTALGLSSLPSYDGAGLAARVIQVDLKRGYYRQSPFVSSHFEIECR